MCFHNLPPPLQSPQEDNRPVDHPGGAAANRISVFIGNP